MNTLFDRYLIVDWSARATPATGPDSIWICEHVRATTPVLVNPATREEARAHLLALLRAGGRTLVGFDFAFGFPAGFARAAGLGGEPAWRAAWSALAERVRDGPSNANNRFAVAAGLNAAIGAGAGPFWGAPPSHVSPHLSARKAPGFPHRELAELRLTERATWPGRRRPSSVWQLAGAGCVGGQTLTGIPVVHWLRHHPELRCRSLVWPFETGFRTDAVSSTPDVIVHAEVWPSSVPVDPASHRVRDAAQVLALSRHVAHLDDHGLLGAQLAPDLDPATAAIAQAEEGWILGAPQGQREGRAPV
jgi:precorrin-8X/cobalt-precorrin-8 methylmutase